MPDTTRTFVAVAVPPALAPRLTRLQEELAGEVPGVRWSAIPPFHVTLAFLGDVPHTHLPEVCRAVGEAARPLPPFGLALQSLGVFPNPSRPRVIWAGVAGPGVEALRALQQAVAAAVAGVGYPAEAQPFHPHVTLGRVKTGPHGRGKRRDAQAGAGPPSVGDLTPVLARRKGWSAGPFPVTEAVTFSSTLTREGPAYAPLARARLSGRKPR